MTFRDDLMDACSEGELDFDLAVAVRARAQSGGLKACEAFPLLFWGVTPDLTLEVMQWVDRTPGAAAEILNQAVNDGDIGNWAVSARVIRHQPQVVMEVTGALRVGDDPVVPLTGCTVVAQRVGTTLKNLRSRCCAHLLAAALGYNGELGWGGSEPQGEAPVPKAPPNPASDGNFKGRLFERCQAEGWPPPQFAITASRGPAHDPMFTALATVHYGLGGLRGQGSGQGRTKKLAEHLAAAQALAFVDAFLKRTPAESAEPR